MNKFLIAAAILLAFQAGVVAHGMDEEKVVRKVPRPAPRTPAKPAKPLPPRSSGTIAWETQPRDLGELAGIAGAHDPSLVLSLTGEPSVFVAARGTGSQLVALNSMNGGDSFRAVNIAPSGQAVDSHGENSPRVLWDGKGALWQSANGEGSDIVFAVSRDWGHSFAKPQPLNDVPQVGYYAGAANGPKGETIALWLDKRDPEGSQNDTASIYCSCSADEGKTWSKNARIAQGVCPCCRPQAVHLGNGRIVAAWRDVTSDNIRDIVVARSTDGGSTWSKPVRVHADNWRLTGCPDTGPHLVKAGSRILMAWYSEGTGSNAGIRLSSSPDGGQTWGAAQIVKSGVLDAMQPSLFVNGAGRAYLSFRARQASGDGWQPAKLFVSAIDAAGKAGSPEAIPGSDGATQGRVAVANDGRVYAAWNQGGSVWFVRGRRK